MRDTNTNHLLYSRKNIGDKGGKEHIVTKVSNGLPKVHFGLVLTIVRQGYIFNVGDEAFATSPAHGYTDTVYMVIP